MGREMTVVAMPQGRMAAGPAATVSRAEAARSDGRLPTARRPSYLVMGMVVFVAIFALFLMTADRVFSAGYLAPLLGVVWDVDTDAGGQWLQQGLLALVRSIPRAGPELLVVMTSVVVALSVAVFCVTLRKRGWPVLLAVLAGLLVALHPVTLYLASCGQPAVLGAASVGILLISVDRAAALSDAQSLMTLGLAFALLFVAEPNALYVVIPVLMAIPWMLRDMRDGISSAALLLIIVVPSLVVIATLLAGSMVVGVAPETILRHWLAVLHGGLSEGSYDANWLSENGGTFFGPFIELLGLCFGFLPMLFVVLWRLVASPFLQHDRGRIRMGTAILGILLAPAAGAFAVFFWHPETRMNAVGTAMAALCAWTMTVRLRWLERLVWMLTLVLGLMMAWQTTWLWVDPDKLAWRTALLGLQ